MQHKAQLGYKTITKITVFRPKPVSDLDFFDESLVFHVEDSPEPPLDEVSSFVERRHDNNALEVIEHSNRSR
jgi:hypothetical protein